MRKLLYSSVLLTKLEDPKHLTIAQRERVVKDGLRDREDSVRVAAGKVVDAWFECIVSEGSGDGTVTGDVVGFLQVFNVVESGAGTAADALQSLFVTRKRVLDEIVFNGLCSNVFSYVNQVSDNGSRLVLERADCGIGTLRPRFCRLLSEQERQEQSRCSVSACSNCIRLPYTRGMQCLP